MTGDAPIPETLKSPALAEPSRERPLGQAGERSVSAAVGALTSSADRMARVLGGDGP